jgi:hypothetical protein
MTNVSYFGANYPVQIKLYCMGLAGSYNVDEFIRSREDYKEYQNARLDSRKDLIG